MSLRLHRTERRQDPVRVRCSVPVQLQHGVDRRNQIPTCFAHDEFRPDRPELTRLRCTEEEPRHRRLEQHGRIKEDDFHTLTPERAHVDVP